MPSSSSLPLKAFDLSIIKAYGNPKSFPNSILVDKNYEGEVSINTNRIQDSRPRFIE